MALAPPSGRRPARRVGGENGLVWKVVNIQAIEH